MAKTLAEEGVSIFIYVKVSTAWIMVGCANSITEDETSSEISVNCDNNGVDPLKFYGTREKKITLGGVYFIYDSTDEATNFSIADFRGAMRGKTKLDVRVGAGVATDDEGQEYTGCMVSSINVAHKNGDASTYNIGLSADTVADYTAA